MRILLPGPGPARTIKCNNNNKNIEEYQFKVRAACWRRGGGGHSDKIVEVQCQGSRHHQLELSPTLREVLQARRL